MTIGERRRLATVFGGLALVAVVVIGRLGELQVLHAAENRAPRVPLRTRALAAARGTILDRDGERLAFDRPVLEIRAEVERIAGFPTADRGLDARAVRAAKERLVRDLLWALARDEVRFRAPAARDALRDALEHRVEQAIESALRHGRRKIDILVDRSADEGAAILALESLDFRNGGEHHDDYRLYLHKTLRHQRVYAEPERASGVVGTVTPTPLERQRPDGTVVVVDDRTPVSGLERLAVLEPGAAGFEHELVDAGRRPMWTGSRRDPARPSIVHTTIDRELQVRADIELAAAADTVTVAYGSPPEWGALVLVDVPTGGVLAAASYAAAEDGTRARHQAFAPSQCLFEPGSVVKPLHLAMVLDRGLCSIDELVDCQPGYRAGSDCEPPASARRLIRDSHRCGVIPMAQVLIQSSNIGAVRLGLRLGPQGIEDYLQHYRFGSRTGVLLPGELAGRRPGAIPTLSRVEQIVFTGPSVLFGYQMQVTVLQVARAYLSFLSRHDRELRLVAAVDVDGERRTAPADSGSAPYFGQRALDLVKDALVQVVEHRSGTARAIGAWLRKLRAEGRPHLEIAGKTGTSQYRGRTRQWNGAAFEGDIRTSSFVGFTPVREPRYLVVCVLQKAGAGSFYGGTYAAPAASRLLVHALEREGGESQASPDRSGFDGTGFGTEPGGSDYSKRR